jgi:colanic acid biosynthesis glycosyl transferase WcaI
MHVQLWSYNYDPEPTGIAPLSAVLAREMSARGHLVDVVAAHPHYPEPVWGRSWRPYRESCGGIDVLRLPLWVGRKTLAARIRQESSFTTSLAAAAPWLGSPDVIVAVSPSFPALTVAMANARARRVPWVLWLQDILPDGAAVTGILEDGMLIRAARRFERAAYRSAHRIVVISDSFRENLCAKGVPEDRMVRIYNPASRPIRDQPRPAPDDRPVVFTMGNVGHSQNLANVVRAFQESSELAELGARMVIAGDGVEGDAVRAAIRDDRVRLTGVLDGGALESEIEQATVALVSQRYEGIDFNVPSKLMNFMGYGLATVGSVRADSEVARILETSGGGWVTDSGDLRSLTHTLAQVIRDPTARAEHGAAALSFAQRHFSPECVADQFEHTLMSVISRSS